jgi:hypothetical protein
VVVTAAAATVPVAAGAALPAVAGALLLAVVLAGAASALLVAAGAACWAALPVSLSWLQAASASRAAHRNGRRFNMADLESGAKTSAPTFEGRRGFDQGVAAGWLSALCRPSM